MLGILILLAWVAALVAVSFIAPGWVLVWELRKGRTIPPVRVDRLKQPGWYWSCIAAHAALWALWILVCAFCFLVFVIMPGLEN